MARKMIVIVGTNASGKSSLGVALARKFGGEIISADSRQVYQGLDLGSGKITEEEKAGVPHHLLDVVSPGAFISMADFICGYLRVWILLPSLITTRTDILCLFHLQQKV